MQGTPLHITVRKNMISNFTHMLKEGKVYSIKNLKIAEANEKYRLVKGTFKGFFLLTTILKEINDPQKHSSTVLRVCFVTNNLRKSG